jgi:hypothetical protein
MKIALRCSNSTNTNLTERKKYSGVMYRRRQGRLSPTNSYNNATLFSTVDDNGRNILTHILRFKP